MTITEVTRIRYSATQLADILEIPQPTPEQREIIESDLETAVVIAGAGSGKTTVIAQRVVYLVANDIVPAQSILGLTFTRKAVGELNSRIRTLLARFRARTDSHTSDSELRGLDVPTVSTYNSYAASIVTDHGISLGIEPDTRVLDIADATALAGEVTDTARNHEVPLNVSRSALIDQILTLGSQINEHLQSPAKVIEEVDAALDIFLTGELFADILASVRRKRIDAAAKDHLCEQITTLAAAAGLGEVPTRTRDRAARQELVALLAEWDLAKPAFGKLVHKRQVAVLVDRYLQLKRQRSAMEFADQVAFAHRIVTSDSAVREIESARWRVIMLDEYQDTSDSQFRLLKTIFAGKPVTAVGDPRQSIYGWRGASARNIGEFPLHFRSPDGSPARTRRLSTSWRNDEAILSVANRLARPLPDTDPGTELSPRPGAGEGSVTVSTTPGAPDEQFGTEQWADLARWMQSVSIRSPESTMAVLCRKRANFAPAAAALAAAGLKVHIAGSSGVLDDPFVADIHSVLHVLIDPGAGDHLMRLLSGTTCGLGASDIAALHRFTRARTRRLRAVAEQQRDQSPAAAPEAADGLGEVGLVEGIDDLLGLPGSQQAAPTGSRPGAGRPAGASAVSRDVAESGLSGEAVRRIVRLARRLRSLRRGVTTVPALVRDVIRELDIDTEIAALSDAASRARRDAVDAFLSTTLEFTANHPQAGIRSFLDWLSVLERKEGLEAPEPQPDPTAVTVMTIHASKGLEFDAVAVPNLVIGDLPSTVRDKHGWLSVGQLPYPLRGDHAKLPALDFRQIGCSTCKELNSHLDDVVRPELEAHHETEERRLAYVAVTRARSFLWLGAALRTTRIKANEFSPFLREAMAVLGVPEDSLPQDDEIPEADGVNLAEVPWPVQDLSLLKARQAIIQNLRARAAAPVDLRALASEARDPEVRAVAERILDLLAETDRNDDFALPDRLSTTGIVSFVKDPQSFADRTLRPMPYPPDEAAGLGTAFHTWIENYFGQATLGDIDLAETASALSAPARERFEKLRLTFERSEFARLDPLAIELPFELVLARRDGTQLHVPGKVDAVFRTVSGIRVVDWKTGSVPAQEELETMSLQLSVYALALSRMSRFAAARTFDAEFYFLGSDTTVRPPRLLSAPELLERLDSTAGALSSGR
ncbi:ATP-dependent DNA helicase [Brevibacterium daeguense]|uniref:DNA 3'-5' helicase n=1 Tax=Brevibacterium daeguense TaxID=909936 RepID=A0ABP8EJI4_9MICO|nr:ATP-dependent DNA helicase [Brevibacterium daeguense]